MLTGRENKLFLGFKYQGRKNMEKTSPVYINLHTQPNLLLSGPIRSGKSQTLLLYVQQLIYKRQNIGIWIGDLKNSGIFTEVKRAQNTHYAVGNDIEIMVDEYYQLFCDVRDGIKEVEGNQILILDEYTAWIEAVGMQDKGKKYKYKNMIDTLLTMGRDVRGVTFNVIIAVQRQDKALFSREAMNNFMEVTISGYIEGKGPIIFN